MDADLGASGSPAGEGSLAIQPRVSASDLADFSATRQGRDLARMEADVEIMLRLSVEGFDGSAWQEVAQALVQYGWAVMGAWISTGTVFRHCRAKGLGGPELTAPVDGISRVDAKELADDVVAEAIVNFQGVLASGRWDPKKGASLSTYFVGNCLLRFANRYRQWRREHGRFVLDGSVAEGANDDPLQIVIEAERSAEVLAPETDPTNREIVQLVADDYAIDEIAELLGLSSKQVESRLYRTRRRLGRGKGEQ